MEEASSPLTPLNGKARRKSLVKTPLRSPALRAKAVLSPNNDEEERKIRRERIQKKARRRSALGTDNLPMINAQVKALDSTQILELYSNCIKLASENKINQKNTWSLQLIDHINDLVKPSIEDGEQTNFQKASCTLDAGVKIYSYRVDSVHNETFKVLGGLNRTSQTNDEDDSRQPEQPDEAMQDAPKKKRSTTSAQSTLEANFESLNVKKFDVTFSVDPLFHKTSAQFDEGGAKGLLLHNLHVHRGCQLVFDSSEVPDYENKQINKQTALEVDLSSMENLLLDIQGTKADGCVAPLTDSLRELLGRSTRETSENHAATVVAGIDTSQLHSVDATRYSDEHSSGVTTHNSMDDDDYDDDFGDDAGDYGMDSGADSDCNEDKQVTGTSCGQRGEVVLGDHAFEWLKAAGTGLGQLTSSSAWAGASHWRYRLPKGTVANGSEEPTTSNSAKPKQKSGPIIDFENLPDVPRGAFDLARKTKQGYKDIDLVTVASRAATLLPTDLHYQASSLAKLFLKPSKSVCTRPGLKKMSNASEYDLGGMSDDDDGEYGGGDWADQWVSNVESQTDGGSNFNSLLEAPRKVEKIEVSYARQAKQVDVRVLKQVVWNLLQEQATEGTVDSDGLSTCSFEKVLAALPPDCPAGAPEDISVHLCFICLLHLCNEHGLALRGREDLSGLQVLHVPTPM